MIQGKKRTTEVRGHTSGSHFDLGNGFLDITKAKQQKKPNNRKSRTTENTKTNILEIPILTKNQKVGKDIMNLIKI